MNVYINKLLVTTALTLLSTLAIGEELSLTTPVSNNKVESFSTNINSSVKRLNIANKVDGNVLIQRKTMDKKKRGSNNIVANTSIMKTSAKNIRKSNPQKSSHAYGFSFYSATTFLNVDQDNDGYYSDFSIAFDADYEHGSANVYAVLYYSENGGDWVEYFITDTFTITYDNTNDEMLVSSFLNTGFPTGRYDILIDLYEDGIEGIVATISPEEDINLFDLPLEDVEHELNSNHSQISYVASSLSGDNDGDGFYTQLTLEYDIDTAYSGDVVFAEIVFINPLGGWTQTVTSDNFILGIQTEFIDLDFNSGYPAGWYNVEIKLINQFTNEEIANATASLSSLASLPIESFDKDSFFDSSNTNNQVDVVIGGGGSMGWILLMLSALSLIRYMRTYKNED
jgi:hypothetical protein